MRPACVRFPVAKLGTLIPPKYIEALEQNQLLSSCCRHPENHDSEAFYSSAEDEARGVPDIYVFHCTCGRKHRRFCVGGSAGSGPDAPLEMRPVWDVR